MWCGPHGRTGALCLQASLLLLLLPLPPLLASLASRVVYSDKMKGRKDPPCPCLSLLLSHLPRGLAAGLEAQVMVGDAGAGDGCSHCGQQVLNMVVPQGAPVREWTEELSLCSP